MRVALNNRGHRRARNVYVLRRDAGLLHLLRQEMSPRKLELLFFRVTREPNHFHAIAQRRLDRIEDVRGRHENHVREIESDVQIVVTKAVVLFRIEDLEQSGRRIAAKIGEMCQWLYSENP